MNETTTIELTLSELAEFINNLPGNIILNVEFPEMEGGDPDAGREEI